METEISHDDFNRYLRQWIQRATGQVRPPYKKGAPGAVPPSTFHRWMTSSKLISLSDLDSVVQACTPTDLTGEAAEQWQHNERSKLRREWNRVGLKPGQTPPVSSGATPRSSEEKILRNASTAPLTGAADEPLPVYAKTRATTDSIAVGIDSGGTHTTFAVSFGDAPPTVAKEIADSISDVRGPEARRTAVVRIAEFITQTKQGEMCVWIGAAGYTGFPSGAARILLEPLASLVRNFDDLTIFVANDAVSALKAPPLSGAGIVAVVGTGSVVMGTSPAVSRVVKRGGSEWLVDDEGSAVWMSLEAIRRVVRNLQTGDPGAESVLLDRLCDYFDLKTDDFSDVAVSHRSLAKAEALARLVSEGRPDAKRRIAGFVGAHLAQLSELDREPASPIAAEIFDDAASIIASQVRQVAAEISQINGPANEPAVPVLLSGRVASSTPFRNRLVPQLQNAPGVNGIQSFPDGANNLAALARSFMVGDTPIRRRIEASPDPVHRVARLQ